MILRKALLFFVIASCQFQILSQSDSINQSKIELQTYVDAYYGIDPSMPQTSYRLPFNYNYNRNNQISINLAFIQLNFEKDRFRSRIGIQGGTYVQDNYKAESSVLKHFSEAKAGLRLSKKKEFWFDAGIMPSHIGFETAIATDNMNLTRSLVAESSPYYMAGAKLCYKNRDTEFEAIVANGWQRINRIQGNDLLSFGSRITVEKERIKFNWSTFVGTDDKNIYRRMRYFNNLYLIYKLTEKWKFVFNIDAGAQQWSKGSISYDQWLGGAFVAQYKLTEKDVFAFRGEYFLDPAGVVTNIPDFEVNSISLNYDRIWHKNVLWRIEAKWQNSSTKLFNKGNSTINEYNNLFFSTSLVVNSSIFVKGDK